MSDNRGVYKAIGAYIIWVVGQTLVMTSYVDIMLNMICRDEYGLRGMSETALLADPRCRATVVAKRVATLTSYAAVITQGLGVLVLPKLSAISDSIGRKPVLIWGALACLINDLLRICCVRYPDQLSYWWLLAAYFVQGTGGTLSAMQMLNGVYVAHASEPETRPKMLGVIEAAFFGSMAIGPMVGSVVVKHTGTRAVIFAMAAIADVTYAIAVYFFIPEPCDKEEMQERPSPWDWNIFRPLLALKFSSIRNPVERRNARILVVLTSMVQDVVLALGPLILIYTEFMFNWTSVEIGYMISWIGGTRMFVLGIMFPILVKLLNKRFAVNNHGLDTNDLILLRIGMSVACVGFLGLSNAPNGEMFVAATTLDAMAALLIPSTKNAIVKYAGKEIGAVMGGMTLLTSLCLILSTQLLLAIFKLSVASHPGLVFFITASFFFAFLVTTKAFRANVPNEEDFPDEDTPLLNE